MNDENLKPRSHNMERHSLKNHLKKTARSNFAAKPDEDSLSTERKRKLTGNTPRDSPRAPKWQPPPEGCCHFCYTQDKARELGELREHEGIIAHHSCLLFSSGLIQAGENEEGLWGFLEPHIKKELSRGKRLKCAFCQQPGALVGCHKAKCPHSYHLNCGFDNACLMQFYDKYRSYCNSHRPVQYFDKSTMGNTAECPICREGIKVESLIAPLDVLVMECCNHAPIHRECLQNQADCSGYFFRCPMCNNEKKFNSLMRIMGINVPLSDAAWEKEGMFDDQYEEYWRCDVPICLHAESRTVDSRNNDKWDLLKCVTCGQAGAHPACVGRDKKGANDWNCPTCIVTISKIDKEREEFREKQRADPTLQPPEGLFPPPSPQKKKVEEKKPVPGTSRERTRPRPESSSPKIPASSAGRRSRKQLDPENDPYLMTPEKLKEAVFKLTIIKMKQAKELPKTLNPEVWTTVKLKKEGGSDTEEAPSDTESERDLVIPDEEYTYPYQKLRSRSMAVVVVRAQYTPPDRHKERVWESVVRSHHGTAQNKVVKGCRGRQLSINSFFGSKKGKARMNFGPKEEEDEEEKDESRGPAPAGPHSKNKSKRRRVDSREEVVTAEDFWLEENAGGSEKVKQEYKCYYCSRNFEKLTTRMEHMRKSHRDSIKDWDATAAGSKASRASTPSLPSEPEEPEEEPEEEPVDPEWDEMDQYKKARVKQKAKRERVSRTTRKKSRDPMKDFYKTELAKYDDFVIETEEGDDGGKKRRRDSDNEQRTTHEWTDREISSLIDFYAMNPILWDKSKRKIVKKEEEVLDRLSRKLGLPVFEITAQWKELAERYEVEKFLPHSTWKFRLPLDFLEETSLLTCPQDVSPLFSLLSTPAELTEKPKSSIFDDEGDLETSSLQAETKEEDDEESPLFGLIASAAVDSTTPDDEKKEELTVEDDESPLFGLMAANPAPSSPSPPPPTIITTSNRKKRTPGGEVMVIGKKKDSPEKVLRLSQPLVPPSIPSPRKGGRLNVPQPFNPRGKQISVHTCMECGKEHETTSTLNSHKLRLRCFCTHCCRNFTSYGDLEEHQRTVRRLDLCPFCDKAVPDTEGDPSLSVMRHISDEHFKRWISVECKLCCATFKRKEDTHKHLKSEHGLEDEEWKKFCKVKDYRCLYD